MPAQDAPPPSLNAATSASSASDPPSLSISHTPVGADRQSRTIQIVVPPPATHESSFVPSPFKQILKHRWFVWVPKKLTWPAFKPVIRCAVAVRSTMRLTRQIALTAQAWLGLIVQLILPSERALGYAACESPKTPDANAEPSLRAGCSFHDPTLSTRGAESRGFGQSVLLHWSRMGMGQSGLASTQAVLSIACARCLCRGPSPISGRPEQNRGR